MTLVWGKSYPTQRGQAFEALTNFFSQQLDKLDYEDLLGSNKSGLSEVFALKAPILPFEVFELDVA